MASTDFQDLLQDAEQMTAQIDQENVGMPKLQRTLSQIFEDGRRKLVKTNNYSAADSTEIKASILLAAKGIDAPKLTQTIENLQFQTGDANASVYASGQDGGESYERANLIERLRDTDIDTFLKSEKEAALMSTIEEIKQQTYDDIEETFALSSEAEWEKQKQKIMQELLGSFNPELSISTATTINSRSSNNMPMHGRTVMTDIELEFSREIYFYNEKIIENAQPKPDLLLNFVNLAKKMNDKNIEETWNMLNCMTSIPASLRNIAEVNSSSSQSGTFIDRMSNVQIQMFMVSQAIKYLENCFKELLQTAVYSNLKQAKLGGNLGTLALVSAYLRLDQSEKYHQSFDDKPTEFFEDRQPIWPTIYLCLRCGDIEAARQVAQKTKKDDITSYLDEILRSPNAQSSSAVAQRHLSVSSENKLKLEYNGRIKRDNDLYKKAVYCYLCRYTGDDDSMNQVLDTVDDFLWFKLNCIVFTGGAKDGQASTSSGAVLGQQMENMTFQEFQTKLSIEYGERHFITNRNPFIYLQVLLLTAQFEMAIEFLLKFETMVVHAVHMAIALFERNLLNLTKTVSNSQLITSGEPNEPKCIRRINFACLIKLYTRKFECTDPREALQYYYFLRNIRLPSTQSSLIGSLSDVKRQTSYFAQYITELALETREFELLFGRLEKNAIRRPGAIDKFISEAEASEIIALVAQNLENKGLLEEAINLFDLSKQYRRVLELCNKLISQIVTEVNISNSNRDRLKNLASTIAIRYKTETSMSNSIKAIPNSIIKTFYLLNDLITFFDLYHAENWNLAYDTLNKLAVLPTNPSNVEPKVKEFISFSEEIKRNFPDLILAAMTILNVLYTKINRANDSFQASRMGSPMSFQSEKKNSLGNLKEHAKALIKFVGCIPYRLSGEINARLLQLEVVMN